MPRTGQHEAAGQPPAAGCVPTMCCPTMPMQQPLAAWSTTSQQPSTGSGLSTEQHEAAEQPRLGACSPVSFPVTQHRPAAPPGTPSAGQRLPGSAPAPPDSLCCTHRIYCNQLWATLELWTPCLAVLHSQQEVLDGGKACHQLLCSWTSRCIELHGNSLPTFRRCKCCSTAAPLMFPVLHRENGRCQMQAVSAWHSALMPGP